ncbi:MAG: hypothetical protein FK734_20070 [Asgard group archaeon]|nr:hypothetical protein [Asgard group archaeon]
MGIYTKTFTYDGTGAQTEVESSDNYGIKNEGTVACSGGASDVYTIQEKIGGEWYDSLSSSSGDIAPISITGRNEAMRLNITTNVSGNIKFSITA